MFQLPLIVPSQVNRAGGGIVTFRSMLWFVVSLTNTAEPTGPMGNVNEPNTKAPKPAPPSEPYSMSGNWPAPEMIPPRLMVTVEAGISAPLTLIIGAVGLPEEFRYRFNVEPALGVNEDICSEVPVPATCTFKAAPPAKL